MQRFRFVSFAAGTGLALLLAIEAAHGQEPLRIDVTLKDHRFSPSEIRVPAGKSAVINLHNTDPTAEEFDSDALDIEKIIAGGRSGLVRLHPLAPGRYPFIGEFHSDTAQGVVIAE
ncbi:MAG: cupredoxin domain-containing protein [Stellaceae bacterium]